MDASGGHRWRGHYGAGMYITKRWTPLIYDVCFLFGTTGPSHGRFPNVALHSLGLGATLNQRSVSNYLGGPPRRTEHDIVHPGIWRHLLQPFGIFSIHETGFEEGLHFTFLPAGRLHTFPIAFVKGPQSPPNFCLDIEGGRAFDFIQLLIRTRRGQR